MGAGSLPCALRFVLSPLSNLDRSRFLHHRRKMIMQSARQPEVLKRKKVSTAIAPHAQHKDER